MVGMRRIRRTLSLTAAEDGENEWPIPIWRPRATPLLPIHRRLLNLLLPKPALDDIIPIIGPMVYIHQSPLPARASHQQHRHDRRGGGRRYPVAGPSRQRLEVHVEEGSETESRAEQPVDFAEPFQNRSHTNDRGNESSNREWVEDEFPSQRSLKHARPSPQYLSSKSAYMTTTTYTPNTSLGQSTRSSRSRISSRRSSSTAPSSNYTFGRRTPHNHPRGDHQDDVPPTPSPRDRLHHHRSLLLHHLRLLHCLHLARQLLYTYNRLALSSLAISSLPPEVERDWERDLDEWWAEISGVLNVARARVRASLGVMEQRWEETVGEIGADMGKERKGLRGLWRKERKPAWGAAVPNGRRGTTAPDGSRMERKGLSVRPDVPRWVSSIVPRPFREDEIEHQIWILEAEGRIPTGTWRRMYGKNQQGRKDEGWEDVDCWMMDEGEQEEAARRRLRGLDVDELGRVEREGWREGGKRKWGLLP